MVQPNKMEQGTSVIQKKGGLRGGSWKYGAVISVRGLAGGEGV